MPDTLAAMPDPDNDEDGPTELVDPLAGFVDLDPARAARRERLPSRGIILGGEPFHVHPELPIETMGFAQLGDLPAAFRSLLLDPDNRHHPVTGDEGDLADWERLAAIRPPVSVDDLAAVLEEYGETLGNSSASAGSSTRRGPRSRRTSRTGTA